MLRKWSANRIISLQVIKPQETWLNEFYCLFFLSWLPTTSSPFLLYFLLSVLPVLFLRYCTLLHPFILNLSSALPKSFSPLLINLSYSHFTSPRLLTDIFLSLSYFSKPPPTLYCFPTLPMLHPYNGICTYAHTKKHMPLSNFLQSCPLTSTFRDKFRSMLLYLFHWKD